MDAVRTIARIVATALAVALAAWLLPGISVHGSSLGSQALTLLLVACLIGLVNAFVRPIVTTLTGCLVLLTLGLFLFVINALMLMLVSWLSGQLGLGFRVDGFWNALFGSIIISFVSGLLYSVLHRERREQPSVS